MTAEYPQIPFEHRFIDWRCHLLLSYLYIFQFTSGQYVCCCWKCFPISTTQFCVPYNHNYRVLCGNHLELSITEKIVFWLRKGQYNWLWNLNQPTFPTSQNFDCMMLSNLRLPQLITITVIFVLLGLICFHLKDWLFKFLRFKFCGDLCNLTDSQPFHFSRFPTN